MQAHLMSHRSDTLNIPTNLDNIALYSSMFPFRIANKPQKQETDPKKRDL